IYGQLRRRIGRLLRALCPQQGLELVEGHALPDPGPLCLSMSPKCRVAHPVGFLQDTSAIRIHREVLSRERHFTGLPFWARGSCVSTIGLDEQGIRENIRNQEHEEKRQGQILCKPSSESRVAHSPLRTTSIRRIWNSS